MDITHLVTIGDSFTYCQGLDDPVTQGWPALVANHYNLPLVNLGRQGAGNDSIYRRACEYVYHDLNKKSKPFFIVAFSQAWRREEWYNKHYNGTSNNSYMSLALRKEPTTDYYERAVFEHWNTFAHIRTKVKIMASTLNLFKAHNIPYLITDYAADYIDSSTHKFEKMFSGMYNYVSNDRYKIFDFHKLTANCPKTSCGHDGIEAQTILKNYITSSIDKLYGSIKVTNIVNGYPADFTNLNRFYHETEAHEAMYDNLWFENANK